MQRKLRRIFIRRFHCISKIVLPMAIGFDMTIRPIKTERDYRKALKEIEKLWDAKQNAPKGDRLDVLVTLVEAYEQRRYKIELYP